jgi:hypothetical protein
MDGGDLVRDKQVQDGDLAAFPTKRREWSRAVQLPSTMVDFKWMLWT